MNLERLATCLLLQSEMRSDSYLLRRLDQHNRPTNRAYVRHLEFDRVRSLRTSPNLQLVAHREMREIRLHWCALRWLNKFVPV